MTQIKNKQHCLCTKGAQYKSNSCECENKLCTRAGMRLMWVTCQANSDSKMGHGQRKHQLHMGGSRLVFPEMAPASSLQSFCSCPSETPGVPQMVLLPVPGVLRHQGNRKQENLVSQPAILSFPSRSMADISARLLQKLFTLSSMAGET